MSRTFLVAILATAGLLALAAPAQAVYVMTPLQLHTEHMEVEVGDDVVFTVRPQNATMAQEWSGRTVLAKYAFDRNENESDGAGAPDEPASNEGWTEGDILPDLRLDENATATFTWRIPEEVQDHNVDVSLVDADGALVAIAHIAVGDAPPQMRMMAGSGPAQEPDSDIETGEPAPAPADASDGASEDAGAHDEREPRSNVPAPGALALVGTAFVAGVALSLLRHRDGQA